MNLQGLSFNRSADIQLKPEAALKLQAGDVVRGIIQAITTDGLVQLLVRGKSVLAEAQVPVQAGQELYLQVDRMENGKLYMRVVDPQAQAELPDLALRGMLTKLGLKSDEITNSIARKLIAYNLPVSKENVEAVVKMANLLPDNQGRAVEAAVYALSRGARLTDARQLTGLIQFFSNPSAPQEVRQAITRLITPSEGEELPLLKIPNNSTESDTPKTNINSAANNPAIGNKTPESTTINQTLNRDNQGTSQAIPNRAGAPEVSDGIPQNKNTPVPGTVSESDPVPFKMNVQNNNDKLQPQQSGTLKESSADQLKTGSNQFQNAEAASGKTGMPPNLQSPARTATSVSVPGATVVNDLPETQVLINLPNSNKGETSPGPSSPPPTAANRQDGMPTAARQAAPENLNTTVPRGASADVPATPRPAGSIQQRNVPPGQEAIDKSGITSMLSNLTSAEGQGRTAEALSTLLRPNETLNQAARQISDIFRPVIENLITDMDTNKPDANQIKQALKEQQSLLPELRLARQLLDGAGGSSSHPIRTAVEFMERELNGQLLYNRLEASSGREQSSLYFTLPLRWQGNIQNTEINVNWRREGITRAANPGYLTVNVGLSTVNLGTMVFHLRTQGKQLRLSAYLDNYDAKNLLDDKVPDLITAISQLGFETIFMGSQVVDQPQLRPEFIDEPATENLPPVTGLDLKV